MLKQLNQFTDLTVTTFSYPDALPLKDYPQIYKQISNFKLWLKKIKQGSKRDFMSLQDRSILFHKSEKFF